jgi:biotin synthase
MRVSMADTKIKELIDRLNEEKRLSHEEWITLLTDFDADDMNYAARLARNIADIHYGRDIYIRGIVEFSNYCRNDCLYCGIRCSNKNVSRYRLTKEEITHCCDDGYGLGFRTFVLQSGEDRYYTIDVLSDIIADIKKSHPDCAVTLSIGELEKEEYRQLFDAGADRYLLRQETADEAHYGRLHPKSLSFSHRMKCLENLKEIGFQTGCGFMAGSPFQTKENVAEDMEFMCGFKPHMIGIGPFIPHKDTPFRDYPQGTLENTLFYLSLCRIMLPKVLLPATTALGTINPKGREMGILAGANVVMPNLSPVNVRKKYMLYDNKICTGDEAAECIRCMKTRIEAIGYQVISDRGDAK